MISLLFSFILQAQAQETFLSDLENFRQHSLSIQTEKQNLKATSDLLLSRKLFWTPRLSVSAKQSQLQMDDADVVDENYLQADANLNLFKSGADWNSLKSAQARNRAQELALLNADLRVEINASDLIFRSLYLIESQKIQSELLRLKEDSLKIANDRYRQGKLPRQEVTKTEVDLIQQKNKVRLARLDLIENETQIKSAFVTEIKTKSWPFTDELEPRIKSRNKLPLIEEKYWTQQFREQEWKSSESGHWPSLDLNVQYQQSPIEKKVNKQWLGLLTLTIPLWSQYETSATVSSNYAQYITALNDFKATEQSLNQRLGFLNEKMKTARANLSEAKTNLEKSKGLYRDILRSFRLGRISTNDLILEQNRLLDTQTALALSQLTFHQTLIETCALAGLRASQCLDH